VVVVVVVLVAVAVLAVIELAHNYLHLILHTH
jgi:hypothetical protein